MSRLLRRGLLLSVASFTFSLLCLPLMPAHGAETDCTQSPDGTVCDDGDACTGGDVCAAGQCTGKLLTGYRCDDANACTVGDIYACAAGTLVCAGQPGSPGTLCDDRDFCTTGDACTSSGACAGTPAAANAVCDDGNPCTENDSCNVNGTGCQGEPIPLDTPTVCDDGNPCTVEDACTASGECKGGRNSGDDVSCEEDGNVCTAGARCNGAGGCGTFPSSGTPCAGSDPLENSTDCARPEANTCDGAGSCLQPPELAGHVCRAAAGVCDEPETCSGTSRDCPAADLKKTTVCRAAPLPCDKAESCSGSGNDCPADQLESAATICRAAPEGCDVPEFCTGSSAACPPDVKRPLNFVCRASAGPCDIADVCDGASPTCVNEFAAPLVTCRAAAGDCDVAETCSGSAAGCPTDGRQPLTHVCRPAVEVGGGDTCDVAETCNGGISCPSDGYKRGNTECRAKRQGDEFGCDQAEVCSGSSATCPIDTAAPAGKPCRSAIGACDIAEACPGDDSDEPFKCPGDEVRPMGFVCRVAGGGCDIVETCRGEGQPNAKLCPDDEVEAAPGQGNPGTVCRPVACNVGEECCDEPEVCTGTANCPSDRFKNAGVLCRPGLGVCDIAEACTGFTAACPVDAVAPDSVICRAQAGECDIAEHCTGTVDAQGRACPPQKRKDPGTLCTADSNPCSVDQCILGSDQCDHATISCSCGNGVTDPGEQCDLGVAINGQPSSCCSAGCQFKPLGTVCRSATDVCDAAEQCSGLSDACPADGNRPVGEICRPQANECDVAERCEGGKTCKPDGLAQNGSTCASDFDACTADVCRDGQCTHDRTCACGNGRLDTDETCDAGAANGTPGSCCSATCQFKPLGTVCRDQDGICGAAEQCSGLSDACPADGNRPVGEICRPQANECDVAERCDGGKACQADGLAPNGSTCASDFDACTADVCRDGQCTHDRTCACGNGRLDTDETCDAGAANGTPGSCCSATCQFKPLGTVCRDQDGICDAAEQCSGLSDACPADGNRSVGEICRPQAGECDVAETCQGGKTCGPDDKRADNAPCSSDFDACTTDVCRSGQCAHPRDNDCTCGDGTLDPDEQCDQAGLNGAAESCCTGGTVAQGGCRFRLPGDDTLTDQSGNSLGGLCRAPAGKCDLSEFCTGVSGTCPADAKAVATICRAQATDCDVADVCTGLSDDCPDAKAPAGTRCADGLRACERDAVCDGLTNVCPRDGQAVAAGTRVCRAAAGTCDKADVCDGLTLDCPADAKHGTDVVCNDVVADCEAGGVVCCDRQERCDGTHDFCPGNTFQLSTVLCREAAGGDAGVCDKPEFCTGNNPICPNDAKRGSETTCRESVCKNKENTDGCCDVAEQCDGENSTCPEDKQQPKADSSTRPEAKPCLPQRSSCEAPRYCAGGTDNCAPRCLAQEDERIKCLYNPDPKGAWDLAGQCNDAAGDRYEAGKRMLQQVVLGLHLEAADTSLSKRRRLKSLREARSALDDALFEFNLAATIGQISNECHERYQQIYLTRMRGIRANRSELLKAKGDRDPKINPPLVFENEVENPESKVKVRRLVTVVGKTLYSPFDHLEKKPGKSGKLKGTPIATEVIAPVTTTPLEARCDTIREVVVVGGGQ